jgi:acyl-CoA reductase-like NAD-dependent aldehyde dehydrogenase
LIGSRLVEGIIQHPAVKTVTLTGSEPAAVRRYFVKISGEGYESGAFFEPTLLDNMTPEMKVYAEEVFGPYGRGP